MEAERINSQTNMEKQKVVIEKINVAK